MDVFNLSLPLFGLIFIGYVSAKLRSLNESALGQSALVPTAIIFVSIMHFYSLSFR